MESLHMGVAVVGGLALIGFAVWHLTGKKRAEAARRRSYGPDSDR